MGGIFLLILNSILLGFGLAMDAFTVSLANGLNEPEMKRGRMVKIAGVFAGFQGIMPLLGWFCVRTVVKYFNAFMRCLPWIALLLLCYIGGKMLIAGLRKQNPGAEAETRQCGKTDLLIQGIATSIDALSVGFTTADKAFPQAFCASLIISLVPSASAWAV